MVRLTRRIVTLTVATVTVGAAIAFVAYLVVHKPAKIQAPAVTPKNPTAEDQMADLQNVTSKGTAEEQAKSQIAVVRAYINAEQYTKALELLRSIRPKLKGSDIQVSYLIEAEIYGKQNQLDKSTEVADAALKVPEIAASPTFTKQWNGLKAQYAAGTNPYTVPVDAGVDQ